MAIGIDNSLIDIKAVKQDVMVQQKKLAKRKGEKFIIDLNVKPKKSMTMLDILKTYHAIIEADDKLYKSLRYKSHDPMKVMIAILEKSNEKDDYVKATLEWKAMTPKISTTNHCACNHGVGWDYVIKNKLNGNIVTLGSDCIINYVGFDQKIASKLAGTFQTTLNPAYIPQIDARHQAWVSNLNKAKEREKFKNFLEAHNLTMTDVHQMLEEFMIDYNKYGCLMGNYVQLYKEGLEYLQKEQYMTNTQFEQWQAYEGLDKKFSRQDWDLELEAFKTLTTYRLPGKFEDVRVFRNRDLRIPKLDNDVKMVRFVMDHLKYDSYFKGSTPLLSYDTVWYGNDRVAVHMAPDDINETNDFFAMLMTYQKRGDFPYISKPYSYFKIKKQTQSKLACEYLKSKGKPQKDWLLVAKVDQPKLDENGQPVTDDQGNVETIKTTMANLYKNDIYVKPTDVLAELEKIHPKGERDMTTLKAVHGDWKDMIEKKLTGLNVKFYTVYSRASYHEIQYIVTGLNGLSEYIFILTYNSLDNTVRHVIKDTRNNREIDPRKERFYSRKDVADFDIVINLFNNIPFSSARAYTPPKPVVQTPAPAPATAPATPAPASTPTSATTATAPSSTSTAPAIVGLTVKDKTMDIAESIWGKSFMAKYGLKQVGVVVSKSTGMFKFVGNKKVPTKDWRSALDKLKGLKSNTSIRTKYPKAIGRALQSTECGGNRFEWCWAIQLKGKERV